MADISICIPTYECHGKGTEYLSDLFSSLRSQSYQDFEIIISDHSQDNSIFAFCENSSDLDITYIRNPNGRGSQPINTNCALNNAEGRIVKILYQDDFFIDNDGLLKIKNAFDLGAKWLINGFSHTKDGKSFFRPMIPKWTEETLFGRNLLGSPSCFSVLGIYKENMDENLKLLIDAELYHRMKEKYGLPYIIEDILVAIREHENSVTSGVNYDIQIQHTEGGWLMNKGELDYVTKKYNRSN